VIIGGEKTRHKLLKHSLDTLHFKEAVLTQPRILQLLSQELFIKVTYCLSSNAFLKLFKTNLIFRERVLELNSNQLIVLNDKPRIYTLSEIYLKRAELLEKFTSDDELIQIICKLSFTTLNQIRRKKQLLDKRLTGDVLLKLALANYSNLAESLPNEPELLSRLNKEQIYAIVLDAYLSDTEAGNALLIKTDYLKEYTDEQILNLISFFEHCMHPTPDFLEAEAKRRGIEVKPELSQLEFLVMINERYAIPPSDNDEEEGYEVDSEQASGLSEVESVACKTSRKEDQQESEDYVDDYSEEDNIEDDRESFTNDSVFEDKIEEKGTECQYCHHGIAPEPQPEIYRIKPKPPSHIRQALNAIWDSRSLFYCLFGVGFAATCFLIGWTLPSFILGGILAAGLAFETAVLLYKLVSYCLNTRNKRIDIELQQDSSALFADESVYNPIAKFSERQAARTLLKQQPTSVLPNIRRPSTLPI
jgi:hypothetical protein